VTHTVIHTVVLWSEEDKTVRGDPQKLDTLVGEFQLSSRNIETCADPEKRLFHDREGRDFRTPFNVAGIVKPWSGGAGGLQWAESKNLYMPRE
jgi:hypothetical protein